MFDTVHMLGKSRKHVKLQLPLDAFGAHTHSCVNVNGIYPIMYLDIVTPSHSK